MKIKVREEVYFHGAYKITKEHRCEDSHCGFWHKLFCNEVERTTTRYWGIDGVNEKITYECGYEINIYKQRLEDEK